MKPILTILLLATLSGCSLSAGPAGKIGSRVKQCCSTLGMATKCPYTIDEVKEITPVSVVSSSLLERSGQILTW